MKGGVDPPGKSQRTVTNNNAGQTNKQQEQISRDILEIVNKYYSRSLIKTFRDAGYTIELNAQNQWEILNYPQITYLNAKLPYILRILSSEDRSLINTALSSNNLTDLSPEIIQIILEIVSSNNSGCDLVRNPIIERQSQYIKDSLSQYIGKVGTIVSGDGTRVDTSDGMKSVANVRVIVPEELPRAIEQIRTPLSPGLYKYLVKQNNTIMIAPSNYVNFSMIKYYGLKYLVPGTPNGGNQYLFFVNIDKILPKVRLLASFGQGNSYNNWFLFLKQLGEDGITSENITLENINTAITEVLQSTPTAVFQNTVIEIRQWIQQQKLNLSDYIAYPGWDNTCFTISEISHPCLNQGIKDIQVAGEFCVICDEYGNCYIVQVTTYSGHYHPPSELLPMVKNIFHNKGYTNLEYFPQHQCLAKSEPDARLQQHECQPYDLRQLQHENAQGAVPFMERTHSVRRATAATATAMEEEE